MIKKFLAALLFMFAAAAFAAVDVNTATQAELESIRGIGPAISARIIEERQKAPFKDWQDMATRVKGVGVRNSAKFSSAGLTVNGGAYTPPPPRASKPQSDASAQAPNSAARADTSKPAKPGQLQSGAPAGAEKQTAKAASTGNAKPSASKAADEPQSSAPVTAPAAKAMTADERKAARQKAREEKAAKKKAKEDAKPAADAASGAKP